MTLSASLPFITNDRVIRGNDRFATVLVCQMRAECPDGIYMVVRYDTGEEMRALASWFRPIPHRRELIRLVHSNTDLRRVSPPCDAAQTLARVHNPPPPGASGPATLTEIQQIADTIRRNCEEPTA